MRRIRLSLHNHSQMSDGYFTVGGLLRFLKDEGYDVISITDHNVITIPHPLQIEESGAQNLFMLRGIELTFPSMHIVCIEPMKTGRVVDTLTTSRVKWLAHPKWQFRDIDSIREVCARYDLDGVELYNAGELVFPKEEVVRWEYNFYAGDDLHIPSQVKTSWMEMDVDELDKDTIITKLKNGEFEIHRQ